MPEPLSDKSMTREERIKWARSQAAENREEILDRHEKQKADAAGRVRMLRDGEIRDRARLLDGDRAIPSIGPVKDEVPWANARRPVGTTSSARFVVTVGSTTTSCGSSHSRSPG